MTTTKNTKLHEIKDKAGRYLQIEQEGLVVEFFV